MANAATLLAPRALRARFPPRPRSRKVRDDRASQEAGTQALLRALPRAAAGAHRADGSQGRREPHDEVSLGRRRGRGQLARVPDPREPPPVPGVRPPRSDAARALSAPELAATLLRPARAWRLRAFFP